MAHDDTPEPASPACAAHLADDAYQGFLPREELLALLMALLEAERAGAKVAQGFRAEGLEPVTDRLLADVQRDEGRYCVLLGDLVRRLGGDPGHTVGAFYEKAMAVEGTEARLAFLNRGQQWVVRKLAEALPKVRDDGIHAALKEMHDTHVANIGRCAEHLAAKA